MKFINVYRKSYFSGINFIKENVHSYFVIFLIWIAVPVENQP